MIQVRELTNAIIIATPTGENGSREEVAFLKSDESIETEIAEYLARKAPELLDKMVEEAKDRVISIVG